jgi:hypothetical protein
MAIKHIIVLFVETPRKFITAIHILAGLLCCCGNVPWEMSEIMEFLAWTKSEHEHKF